MELESEAELEYKSESEYESESEYKSESESESQKFMLISGVLCTTLMPHCFASSMVAGESLVMFLQGALLK